MKIKEIVNALKNANEKEKSLLTIVISLAFVGIFHCIIGFILLATGYGF